MVEERKTFPSPEGLNAYSPILVMLEGMLTEVRLVQPWNIYSPILDTLEE